MRVSQQVHLCIFVQDTKLLRIRYDLRISDAKMRDSSSQLIKNDIRQIRHNVLPTPSEISDDDAESCKNAGMNAASSTSKASSLADSLMEVGQIQPRGLFDVRERVSSIATPTSGRAYW